MTIKTEKEAVDFVTTYVFQPHIRLHTPCVPTVSKVRKSEHRYKVRSQQYDENIKNLSYAHEAHTILCAQLVACDYDEAEILASYLVKSKKILKHLNDSIKELKLQLEYIIHIELPQSFNHDKHHIELFDF